MQKYLKIGYYLQEIKITINMKIILSFPSFYFAFQDVQTDHPEPAKKNTYPIMYIQHSG
jgi:hypothetical protein